MVIDWMPMSASPSINAPEMISRYARMVGLPSDITRGIDSIDDKLMVLI